jgi:ribonuclease Z
MVKLIILGTSNAIPDVMHENTHLAIVGKKRIILIDCANNPTIHLANAGIDIQEVTDLILTHFHPDHVSGVPSLLMNSWLMGRSKLLNIYGLTHTLDRVENLMDAYDWKEWPNFYPVVFHRLPEAEMVSLIEVNEFKIYASLVCHMIPTIGLRIELPQSDYVLAYSSDTEPCQSVINLSKDADLLIHEATGEGFGHSSAEQAAEIAREAGAKKLMLIHFRAEEKELEERLSEARKVFNGEVVPAEEFLQLDL